MGPSASIAGLFKLLLSEAGMEFPQAIEPSPAADRLLIIS
jgi:hypothetical protein